MSQCEQKWNESVLTELLGKLEGQAVEWPSGAWPETVVCLNFPDGRDPRFFSFKDVGSVNAFCTNYVIRTGVSVIQLGPHDAFEGFTNGGVPLVR